MPLFVTVTPGTTVTNSTTLDATTLNLLGTPSVDVTGTVDGGSLTLSAGSVTTVAIADNAVTFAKLDNIDGDRLIGRDDAGSGDPTQITVGGGLQFTGGNAIEIGNGLVTYAKIQNTANGKRLIGRAGTAGGIVDEITVGTGLTLSDAGTLSVSASVKTWTSAELTVPNAGSTESITFASTTLGGAPDIVAAYLKCVDAGGDATYALNDTLEIGMIIGDISDTEVPAFSVYLNSSSVNILRGNSGIGMLLIVPQKTTGYAIAQMTASKWRLIVKLLKFG